MASISSSRPNNRNDIAADTRGRPGDATLNRQLQEDGDAVNRRKAEEHSATDQARFFMNDVSARAGQAVKGAAQRMSSAAAVVGKAASDVASDISGHKNTDKLQDIDLGSTSLRDRQRVARQHSEEHSSELLKHTPSQGSQEQPPLLRQDEMLHLQTDQRRDELSQKLAPAGARTTVLQPRRLSAEQGPQTRSLTTDDKPMESSLQLQAPQQPQNKSLPQAPPLSPTWKSHNLEHGSDSNGSSKIPASAFDAGMSESMGNIGEKAAKDVQKALHVASDATSRAAHKVAEKASGLLSRLTRRGDDLTGEEEEESTRPSAHDDHEEEGCPEEIREDTETRTRHLPLRYGDGKMRTRVLGAAGHTVKEFFSDVGAQVKEDTQHMAQKTAEVSKKAWTATATGATRLGHTVAEDSKQFAHKVDETAHKVADSTSHAMHSAKESTETVAHKMATAVRDGAKRAGSAIVNAYDKTAAAVKHAFEKTGEAGAQVAEGTVDGLAYTASAGAALGKSTANAAEHATDVVVDKTRAALNAAGNAASYVGHATVDTAKDAVNVSKAAVHNLAAKVADKTADNQDQAKDEKEDDLDSLANQNVDKLSGSLARTATDIHFQNLPAQNQQEPVHLVIDHQSHEHEVNVPSAKVVTPLADHQGQTVSDVSTMADKDREANLSHHTEQSSFGAHRNPSIPL